MMNFSFTQQTIPLLTIEEIKINPNSLKNGFLFYFGLRSYIKQWAKRKKAD